MKDLDRKNIEDIAALTSMQEGMLFHYLKDPGSDAYFEQLSLRINGHIDNQIFKQAWNAVIRTNEMLRTVFRWESVENPIQIVLKEQQFQPQYYDLSGKEIDEADGALAEMKVKDRKKKFDLREVPFRVILCKIQELKYEMIISNHHILYDGWSNGIILYEFFDAYEALIGREPAHLSREHPKTKFKEFIKWNQNRDREKEEQFWRSYFRGVDTQIGLSVKRSKRGEIKSTGSCQVRLEREEKERIEDFVKKYQSTLASLFYSAWGLLLQKYNSCDDVIFGTTVSGRTAKIHGIEDIVGLFINTLPLRIQTTPGETIKDLLHRVDKVLRVREEFENSSLVDIRKYSDIDTQGELFDSMVILENYPLPLSMNNRSLAVESYSLVEETHYDLTVMIRVFEEFAVSFIYNKEVFDDECIVNMFGHFMKIIREMVTNPDGNTVDPEIITREEKNRILYDFNHTGANFPGTRTIHQLFEEQAKKTPDHTALIGNAQEAQSTRMRFEGTGGLAPLSRLITLTYSELNERSSQLARLLREKSVQPDTIVAIMVERSVAMIIGILGILKAGGAYLPIDPDYPPDRIKYMLKDSQARVFLKKSEIRNPKSRCFQTNPNDPNSNNQNQRAEVTVLNFGHLDFEFVSDFEFRASDLNPSSLAYIIYTSGSTGSPKGVMVEHRPVVNVLAALQKEYPLRESDAYLLKTSYSFDVSVTELFGWFWQGGKLVVLEAGEEKDPVKIIDSIERFRITHINFVPSMFNVFVAELLPRDIIKLCCLKYIFLAGEAVLPEVINKFRHLNTSIILENIYGPTEGTVYSSKYSLSHWDGIESIPIGRPLPNVTLYILDSHDRLNPVGIPGELCIGGAGVARGYLNNPGLTREKFIFLFKRSDWSDKSDRSERSDWTSIPGKLYKTGDLARWLPEGDIEFLGRMDQQVKVRGFRIELGEIENHLLAIEEIKEAVVLAREDRPGDKYLCAYIVSPGKLEPAVVRDRLSGRLPGYMIPSYFVQVEEIPLTPNGKVDRKALPAPGISVGKDYAAPRDEIEKKLVEIWSGILCRDASHASHLRTSLGIDNNFFEWGGHSLKATRLVSRIHKELNVLVPLQQIFILRTIRGLASYLKGMKPTIYSSIEMKEKRDYYPLAPAQERMYILQQANPEEMAYNMPKIMLLEGDLDKGHIEAVFQKLIQRHESLRTSFHLVDDVPVQVVHDEVVFEIEYDRSLVNSHWSLVREERFSSHCQGRGEVSSPVKIGTIIQEFVRPFDLSCAPLLRVGLIELPHTPAALRGHPRRGTYNSQEGKERKHILMLDMQHIISDGVSIGVFIRDFIAVYSGKELGPMGISYKDFSWWQNSTQGQETIKNQEAYWLKQFEDEIPVLNLPLDYGPPMMRFFEGHTLHFEWDREDTETLNNFVKREGITLFMTLLAAFNILMAKLSGQDDILVGTPSGGRMHPDLENIMGMFVNTLVLRSFPAGYKRILDFLKEIKEITLEAFENRDYPFEELVRHLVKEREANRNPLFDVMFTLQDLDIPVIRIPGLTVTPLEYEMGISKFDLTIIGEKAEEKMLFTVEYRTRLFKETTIKRLIGYFKTIVFQVIRVLGISISEIEWMSKEEKEKILSRFNDTRVDYPVHKTIDQLFEEQVQMRPDQIAVSGPCVGTRFIAAISYRELNERSYQLACLLQKKGVKPDDIAAIMMERSVAMIIGILGILKAGGAYLPIDMDYPEERIKYILKDSGVSILLAEDTESRGDSLWSPRPGNSIISLGGHGDPPLQSVSSSTSTLTSTCQVSPANLAYIIYTSGSTGKPKGVMAEHSSVVNLVLAQKRRFNIDTHDRILQFSSTCFDASVEQIFITLSSGAALIIIDKATLLDTHKFPAFLSQQSITHLDAVPSFLNQVELKEKERYTLKRIISGGEVCPVSLARKLSYCCDFYNQYGPTETTVTSIAVMIGYDEVDETLPRLPIGRPIDNTTVYVLDKWMKPVCLGAPGELFIGGAGVARGYLNNPELTAEKFDHDLWDYQDYQDKKNYMCLEGTRGLAPLSGEVPGKNHTPYSPYLPHLPHHPITPSPHYPIYRTGDLARWLPDGCLEFLGRIDHQVKIRGFRVEPGEIESRLLKYPGIKDAVVIIRTGNEGDKHLCAYITAGKTAAAKETIDITGLREFLSASLPGYMIPSYFLQLEQLPLTSNGKVDRKALPEPGISAGKDYAAPGDKIEKKLVEIWSEILCRDSLHASQLRTSLGIHDNFFAWGGHSLKATILASRVCKEFKVKFPLSKVFSGPTIKAMSGFIKSATAGIYRDIQPVEKKDYYPQSSAQKRLYFLQQMDPNSTGYNMSLFLPPGKGIERAKLEPAVKKLIARHESLRTSFASVNDVPVQRIHDSVQFEIEYYQVEVEVKVEEEQPSCLEGTRGLAPLSLESVTPNSRPAATLISSFIRPFDLSQAPLLRVGVIELPHTPAALRDRPSPEGKERMGILMVDMHHIISDGTSTTALLEDFLALYPGNELPGLRLQYKDFSQWQNRWLSSDELKAQENYWREVYHDAGEFPRLQLLEDYKRPGVFTFAGDHVDFIIERPEASAFKTLGSRNGATLYMNILAVLNALFYKITSQTDIVIGTGIAGRPHADLQGIIGMFVNTLAMRNYPQGEKTYEFFLKEVAASSVEAFENQDVQFEELVEKLEPPRDPSRNPLFDISMVVQNFKKAGVIDFSPGNFPPLAMLPSAVEKSLYDADYKNTTSKFDMTFFIHEDRDNIEVDIEYYTAVFKKETMQRLVSYFINLVKTVIKSPETRLKDIEIISEAEKNHLFYEFNDTAREYPREKTIPGLFADRVERTPDYIAIVGPSVGAINESPLQITYKELNERANQLANYLVLDRHIQPESLVGILIERSIHQLVALLGVLKSGGAYLPLDTSLPEERMKNIIDDAGVGIIISQERLIRVLNRLQWECSTFHTFLCLDSTDIYSEEEIEKSQLMDEKLWDYVAESATDEITGGGWFSSYTGEPFSKKEMEEYGDNILKKLLPLVHPGMRVLEIGCGSGISMYRIAPRVGFYYGTDLSGLIIAHNKKRVEAGGHKNIALSVLPAHEIDKLDQRDFDLVIINSVIQSFHGHNYLGQVLGKAIDRLKPQGYLFIGDIPDQDLKADLIKEMTRFKYSDKGTSKTKTDWTADLFVSRLFFEDLSVQWREISAVEFSDKIYTIENELTRFRYDVLITIDKRRKGKETGKPKSRNKYQHDGKALDKFPRVPVEIAVDVKPGSLAYVIYTSGSTGSSKGVMVTHRNVLRLVKNANYIDYIDFKGGERFLLTGAFAFDITTFEIWGLLLNGIYLCMVDKEVILEGERLQEAVLKHGISIMHFIPQLFNQHAVDFPGIFAVLDGFLIGGDRVSAGVVTQVRNKFKHLKILHMYGPTENTTFSTYFPVESDYDTTIPIGKPVSNTTVYILNHYHQLQPIGAAGELCTGGDGVARGYLNHPELTAQKFQIPGPQITQITQITQNHMSHMSYIYQTGDLARWLPDGNIEFLGRADFQVKIRGYRIELEEIRDQLLKHELITEVVVIDRQEENGGKYLCAYFVSKKALDLSDLNDFLSRRLPGYMMPSYFVRIDKIPVNLNGKVDRKALPAPESAAREDYTPPGNILEKKLVEIWSGVLGGRILIGLDDNFFAIGGHSLKATILTAKIHKELGIKVPLAEIFKHQTLRELSGYIQQAKGCREEYISIEPVEKKDYYILSSVQERLYVLHQLDEQGIGYNLSAVALLEGELDKGKLAGSFRQLIDRHESLRTSFRLVEGKPVQVVHDEAEFEIEYYQVEVQVKVEEEPSSRFEGTRGLAPLFGESAPAFISSFIRPLDLSRAPLLRVGLLELPPTPDAPGIHPSQKGKVRQYILMLDMHHIITDGTSLGIIINEWMSINTGEELLPLKLRYKDYSEWQHHDKQEQAVKVQEKYWLKQFAGELPELNLPYDYPRPRVQGFAGRTSKFEFGKTGTSALKALALQQEITLYMLLLAIYYVFLAKLSGQEDIIVGTPTAGRQHADLQQVIGMFVNTLALRNFPTGDKTFKKFLEELKQRTLEANENQEYQFEELVEKVVIKRDASRNPLFDTMFALQNLDIPEVEIRGLKVKPYDHEGRTAVFDLVLEVNEVEEGLWFKFSYSTGLFREETIQRFTRYFKGITAAILKHSQIKLSQIEMIPEEEKRKILLDFNDRETRYPHDKMLHELFAGQVERTPNHVALMGAHELRKSRSEGTRGLASLSLLISITYRELDSKSNQLFYLLQKKGVKPDTIVAVMVERSVEMIIGILGILKTGSAYLPIDPSSPRERISYMLADSKVQLLLTDNPSQHFNCQLSIVNCQLSMNEKTQPSTLTSTSTCQVSPANLAYIIYTSGTTGKPKGVLVSHGNISPLLHWGKRYLGINPKDRVIQNFSYYFDGSVWEIFIALTTGAGLYMVPKEIVPDPAALVDFIRTNAITAMLITPTQYQYLIQIGKRLDTLRYLFIGAEKLTVDLVERSIESVASSCRVFNMYGPTEAAVISTSMEIHRQDIHRYKKLTNVPIGRPVGNTVMLILDRCRQLCPINVTGELVIAGDAVARGYLNNPELTAEKFEHDLWDFQDYHDENNRSYRSYLSYFSYWSYISKEIYKTGDLARWLEDGTIEFLGRLDQQVKIRGFRIELAEIENRLLDHQDIREAIVIDRESKKGEKYLCAYIVPEDINHFDNNGFQSMVTQLRSYLSRELPDYMIPAYFVRLPHIPLSPNGKLDRNALPEPEVNVKEALIPPGNELEKNLADIWAEILGIEKDSIGIDSDFFQLGGHSLKATFMLAKIRNEFNIDISLREIFKTPNIRGISSLIKAVQWAAHQKKDFDREREEIIRFLQEYVQEHENEAIIEPAEKKEYYGLSSAQKRLYILQQMDKQGLGYNIPFGLELEGQVDKHKLEDTFRRLLHRHESFRTSFEMKGNEPVQKIHEHVEFEIEFHDLKEVEAEVKVEEACSSCFEGTRGLAPLFIKEFIRPFDLSQSPLLRVSLIELPPQEGKKHQYILMLDMHHIISDGTSIEILTKEFMKLHTDEAENLPAFRIQYKDYAQWQSSQQEQTGIKKQEEYWKKDFEIHGEIPVLNLILDFPRPPVQSFTGRELKFEISSQDTGALKKLAHEEEASLYMVLLSIYTIFLAKLSNQEDIIVGTPVAGRRHDRLRNIIGMFVNTLALRNFPGEEMEFMQFLQTVKERALAAFAHQDYPFEELVEAVAKERDTGRNPLFDTLFVLQNVDIPALEIPGLSIKPYPLETRTSKFDLSLNAVETVRNLSFTFEYSSKLFREDTIQRFTGYFKRIIVSVLENKEIKLSRIEMMPEEEKKKILIDFNDMEIEYPGHKTIHQLFEEQVNRTPGRTALIGTTLVTHGMEMRFKGTGGLAPLSTITYSELNERSDRLASFLKERGLRPDSIVAILVERSIEMIIGLLGILKAGGAYLPIDPAYPGERIDFMLKDSGAEILLKDNDLTIPPSTLLPFYPSQSSSLAYIIYTSGTTGRPKGCMVSHQNVVSLLKNKTSAFDFNENDVWTMFHRYNFDFSVWEMYGALLYGGKLIIIPKSITTNLEIYLQILKQEKVTVLNQTPSAFYQLSGIEMSQPDRRLNLRYIIFGGEALSPIKLKKWKEKYPSTNLVNMFGITETTIHVTYKEIEATEIESNTSNIGRPLPTLSAYVMDRNLNLQPIGIPGELCVAGEGVTRGYLNNPELTSERFIYHRSYQSYKSYISYLSCFYRSGDLMRWLANGDIEYLGRIDHQVKIRGFRIELGEIQNQLINHHEIKEAVVILSKEKPDQPYLCAYFTADRNLPETGLRDYLLKCLPDYMIPSYFVQVDKIPLTLNGKIDKKALPEPGLNLKENYTAPRDEIEKKLVEIWAGLLGRDASHASQLQTSLGIDDNYFEIGGNSLSILAVNKKINQVFKKEVAVIDMFRYTTIRSLAHFLQQQEKSENFCPVLPPAARGALFEKTAPLDSPQKLLINPDIAVIGMAGRFPGAKNIDEFWENLKNGVECTWFFNDLELEISGVERHFLEDPGYVKSNAVLEEIEYFDPAFFGYSPREAEIMDPQARMFHECAWNALEDAGYTPDTYEGLIGLYAGAMYNFDWETRVRLSGKADVLGGFASWQLMNKDFLSMWVSYRLNLKGPAVFIQTSCSTSLTAVHLACQAIIHGECDMALAGGVSVNVLEKTGYQYQEGMVLSPDGHCRAFDAKAAGASAGNGLGIVVLKPLEIALNDNDHIYALVKGTAVNNDGIRKTGFTAPSIEGQAEVIIAAQKIARVKPESITYVETHGTGTPLGDPLEIAALKLAFQRDPRNNKNGYCALGSVKTNIGHLDTAAGITGFIKTVLSIYHRLIPPSLHFENSNPKINFKNSPFYVNTWLKEWKCDLYPLRAGVSSFGMGGTNAHVILEEFPLSNEEIPGRRGGSLDPPLKSRDYQLIVLSAKTPSALDKMTENLAEYFKKNLLNPGNHANPANPGPDAAYTLQVGRKVFEHRRMLVCSHTREAIELLSSPGTGKVHTFFSKETQRPVIFMFAGQGSQYIDMGYHLYLEEPVFRQEMERCFEIINPLVNHDIKEILYPSERSDKSDQSDQSNLLHQTEIALPIIFIFEYALAKLLMNWGIKPQAMIGYSVGEYVPACLAGVFSLEDAISLLVLRGKLTRDIPAGVMLSVPLPEDQLQPLLDEDISLAVVNGPSCVVSGPVEAMIRLEQKLKEQKLLGIRLNISHAMHSPMMDPILEPYETRLRQVSLNPPQVPFISNVTGTWIKKEEALDPGYWIKQMRQPVRFADGLKELLKENQAIFVEIGPGSDLSTILRQQLNKETGHQPLVLNTVRHPQQQVHDVYYLLNRIGRLWMYGTPIDWRAFHAGENPKRISLPTYPYDRKAYLLDMQIASIQDWLKKESQPLPRDQGKKSDLSEWFYIPGWKISPLPFRDSPAALESLNWLILGDDTRLTEKLVQKLQQNGQQVIPVTPGVEFGSKDSGENTGHTINPGEENQYLRLLETLAARDRLPHRVVHLWGMMEWDKGGADKNSEWYTRVQEGVFDSLVYLTKAIGKQALDKKIQLIVVSSHMQGVNGNDLLYPEKALLLGPVRTIPREYPNIACRSIDFALDKAIEIEPQEEQMIHRLWQETWWVSSEDVVAYRGIHRLTQTYDPFPLKAPDAFKTGPRLRQQGIYLVTGGLGGIGLTLAEYLARTVQARLILTGRSPFPSRNNWDQWLEQHTGKDFEDDPIGSKIRKLKELEEIGAEVMVVSADVSDLRQMKEVITAAENQWGKINGIVHCAGIVQGGLIQQVTPEQVLDGFRSKVSGTLVLDALFKETTSNLDFFILCSSLNALLGVMGEVVYCAANAFLDAYALQKTSRDRVFTAAINWDAWQGIGFAREVEKRFANNKNLSPLVENVFKFGMLATEGVEVFKRVLATDTPRLVVSTVDLFERFKAANAIETSAVVDFKEMKRSLNRYPRPELSIPYTPPENETQRLLCETWEKFLGIEQVGIHDNFFELGATSLAIVQVTAILKETLERDIPVPTMYAYPTVKELARYLSGDTIETGASPGEIAQLEAISKGKNKLKQRKQRLKEDNLV